jgi:hypothetical protein
MYAMRQISRLWWHDVACALPPFSHKCIYSRRFCV